VKYQIGKQTVIAGDCLTELQAMAPESVDVIVTSPPYNIGIDYGQHDDRQPRPVYLTELFARVAELHRVLKVAGSFFLNIGTGIKGDLTLPHAVIDVIQQVGFVPQNRNVWIKAIAVDGVIRGHNKPLNSPLYLTRMYEEVIHFTKNGNVRLDKLAIGVPFADKSNIARRGHAQDLRDRGNVWFIPYDTVQTKAGKYDHPAGFPIELPTWCIKLHGVRPDLVVLDPFLGAGTTLVAAQQLGCCGIGFEIDLDYVETAFKRLQAEAAAPVRVILRHSRIGPSQAELIWHCPGSVKAQGAAGPRATSEAAHHGTELHAAAEECLRTGGNSTDSVIVPYIEAVRETARRAGVVPLIEQRLDLTRWHPELFGTADALVVDIGWGVLTVFDLKTGLIHVPADALQLRLYAGMAFMALPPADQCKIKFVDTIVVQPNGGMDPVRRARHTVAEIITTLSDYVDCAHVATGERDPPLHAGAWCRSYFCSARTSCDVFRAFTAQEAVAEFTVEAEGATTR
jgi:site-specific DNA-methyltransferase (adenine-specific)